jgi:predicted Zn-ribbon and HTH transcriptional regulator
MTCRVARSFQNNVQLEPIHCRECGSTYEVFLVSRLHGPHLCPICVLSMVKGRVRKDNQARLQARLPTGGQPVA